MERLSVKTRGDSSPQGKSRVWFCAHPDDYETYLEPIAKEILEKQNCAFYYDEVPFNSYDPEDFFTDLSQMNLFVMPVTSRLLTTENRALDVEFAYAMEHHIPVLPLMQESGLEKLFNEKCGDLQFLDKNQRDSTAIGYEEKLNKYLSSVLIGDELAAKVREAFDAYIFLSYRKKDRKYAQELMRLIHENDFCRDIAIWYDEFLTPGEDFNTSIAEALKKSKLFALAVTPNLINEKNYVMTVEYPEAKKINKKILPAEMVSTDFGKLQKNYPGIPACTNAYDHEELSATLQNALEFIVLRSNDNDPKHNFFIGLAYLGGIDVEINHERAVSLITSAAEAGLPEAMEKLVSMYRIGEGVARNYEIAVAWQSKLVDRFKDVYMQTKSEADAFSYLDAAWLLGDYWFELLKLDEAKSAYEQLLTEAASMDPCFEPMRMRAYKATGYKKLGHIEKELRQWDSACKYYAKSLDACESSNIETATLDVCVTLAGVYHSLGDIAEEQDKWPEAEDYFTKSVLACERLVEEAGMAEFRLNLSIVYSRLGQLAYLQRKLDEAKVWLEKGLVIIFSVNDELKTADSLEQLSCCYGKLGNIALARGDLAEAKEYYRKQLDEAQAFVKMCDTIESHCHLAASYNCLGEAFEQEGNLEEAIRYWLMALQIYETLAENPKSIKLRRLLFMLYAKLGSVAFEHEDLVKAREYYERFWQISQELAGELQNAEAYDDFATACVCLSLVEEGERASTLMATAMMVWSTLSEQYPQNEEYSRKGDEIKKMLGL